MIFNHIPSWGLEIGGVNMVTYKTIVVPTDGSENAKRALEHALAVADRNKAELIVVHVSHMCGSRPVQLSQQTYQAAGALCRWRQRAPAA